jgi:hypothetical protein
MMGWVVCEKYNGGTAGRLAELVPYCWENVLVQVLSFFLEKCGACRTNWQLGAFVVPCSVNGYKWNAENGRYGGCGGTWGRIKISRAISASMNTNNERLRKLWRWCVRRYAGET